jgi:hypothetical protein
MAWWKKARVDPPSTQDKPSVEEGLRRIAKADTVAFGGVGIAAAILPETEAYFALEEALPVHGAELRPQLERLLDHATPAGKVYAAELLTRIDPEAGKRAWARLAGDKREVQTFTGCIRGSTTLRDYAKERLTG